MSEHTPGPWNAEIKETVGNKESGYMDRYWVLSNEGGYQQHPWILCELPDFPSRTGKANAHLIAAAPDLLEEHRRWSEDFGEALVRALQGDYSRVDTLARELHFTFRGGVARIRSAAINRAEEGGETAPA
jgi:hypothetical protein